MLAKRNGIELDTIDVRVLAKSDPRLWTASDTRQAHRAIKFLVALWDDRATRTRECRDKSKEQA